MTTGIVTYPGVLFAKGAVYTQTRGVEPDSVAVRIVPQSTPIASVGDINLYFEVNDVPDVLIPDCLADKSNVWVNDAGFTGTVLFQDRRWRWSRVEAYSWHINERNSAGVIIEESRFSLREILRDLFAWIGEVNVDVSRVNDSFYPEYDLRCVQANEVIADICAQYGYEVCLGFGEDPVEVWPLGSGRSIDTEVDEVMRVSVSVDPKTPPQYSQVCFGPSYGTALFLAVPVGWDFEDKIYKKIDDLPYKPIDGWKGEPPKTLPNVRKILDESDPQRASALVDEARIYRTYQVVGFANGRESDESGGGKFTLGLPDGTGTLTNISQLYPFIGEPTIQDVWIEGRSPSWIDEDSPGSTKVKSKLDFAFYPNTGIIKFPRPVFRTSNEDGKLNVHPAVVFIELGFRIRDIQTRQFVSYVNTLEVDPSGFGVHTHNRPSITSYSKAVYPVNDVNETNLEETSKEDLFVCTGTTNNKDDLDEEANSIHAATAGLYTSTSSRVIAYNKLMSGARCDGLTSQVQHVISDGTGGRFSGHHTVVAQNTDYDTFIRTAQERQHARHLNRMRALAPENRALRGRAEKAND